MLFCLVSAGAFGIEEIIPSAGPGLTLIILIVPFVWARPISRLVAEANAILPREGGIYAWAKETFGEFWGFQAAGGASMDTYISSGAYIAMVGGYTSQLLSLDDAGTFGVALLVVASFTVINLWDLWKSSASARFSRCSSSSCSAWPSCSASSTGRPTPSIPSLPTPRPL